MFRRVGEATLRHLGVPAATGGDALRALAERRSATEHAADAADPSPDGAAALAAEPPPAVTERAPAEGEVDVPACDGMTARGALVALYGAGLRAELEGSGVVTGTEPSGGAVVRLGSIVRVLLARPSHDEPLAPRAEDGVGDRDGDGGGRGGGAPATDTNGSRLARATIPSRRER